MRKDHLQGARARRRGDPPRPTILQSRRAERARRLIVWSWRLIGEWRGQLRDRVGVNPKKVTHGAARPRRPSHLLRHCVVMPKTTTLKFVTLRQPRPCEPEVAGRCTDRQTGVTGDLRPARPHKVIYSRHCRSWEPPLCSNQVQS
ncbi:hypothetical protein J6590_019798 [Homalodisca vitripennis]|nr:hypothetical protein J6590_019798 [Homalodisca vitripennis]